MNDNQAKEQEGHHNMEDMDLEQGESIDEFTTPKPVDQKITQRGNGREYVAEHCKASKGHLAQWKHISEKGQDN